MHLVFAATHPLPASAMGAGWEMAQKRSGLDAKELLNKAVETFEHGCNSYYLQRLPHMVLLDKKFYVNTIRPLVASWTLIWLHQSLGANLNNGGKLPNSDIISYIQGQKTLSADQVPDTYSMKLINLAATWVCSFMPHCLSKINRVSYGLLSPTDKQAPSAPYSRRLMAVPFM
jgi:hypothetical protein